jgi:hypothetical protein
MIVIDTTNACGPTITTITMQLINEVSVSVLIITTKDEIILFNICYHLENVINVTL